MDKRLGKYCPILACEALRRENIEAPAGSIESDTRAYTVRIDRAFQTPEDTAQGFVRLLRSLEPSMNGASLELEPWLP